MIAGCFRMVLTRHSKWNDGAVRASNEGSSKRHAAHARPFRATRYLRPVALRSFLPYSVPLPPHVEVSGDYFDRLAGSLVGLVRPTRSLTRVTRTTLLGIPVAPAPQVTEAMAIHITQ